MSKHAKNDSTTPGEKRAIQLPKDALARVNLGQAFAEYDLVRGNDYLFVRTPALLSALDSSTGKSFYVGRRGTGKTAITFAIERFNGKWARVYPELFSPLSDLLRDLDFSKTHQQPFRSLISAFKRSLEVELLLFWLRETRTHEYNLPVGLQDELSVSGSLDFDTRILELIQPMLGALRGKDDRAWLTEIRKAETIAKQMESLYPSTERGFALVIDRIDESWDGSECAVVFLVALMHACLKVSEQIPWARVLLFLRENVFERVRTTDTEFARLETCVVGLDWTKEQLLEMVERRLNLPFHSRLPVDGTTWNCFFENGDRAKDMIFDFCQYRPRDLLTYCSFAVQAAQSHSHNRVMVEDIQQARKRFSDSRLKDLGDEYSENYPQIQLVLSRFYGLGRRYTLAGVESLVQKLLTDDVVRGACASWLFNHTAPERFAQLLYDIGFFGFDSPQGTVYRSLGPRSTVPPALTSMTEISIHPCYVPALELQDVLVASLDESVSFMKPGLLSDLPEALDLAEYQRRLSQLEDDLKTLPTGTENAGRFEELVGEVLRLCFYRWLQNVKPHERDCEGRVVRDWIASNRASDGFWQVVRARYDATQVVWECKNYEDLDSGAFQQVAYYLTKELGRFAVIAFRGEVQAHQYQHVKRIANDKDGMVLLLGQKDLMVFIRQARNGKLKEDHIQDRYDATVRKVS
jgi:hypothetical protein